MMRVHRGLGCVMVVAIALGGCAPTVMAPTVPIMPGPNKPFDQFAADQQACQSYANAQVAPLTAQANNQALGSTLLTTALGAGLGAAIGGGRGAAIGAASGAVVGGATGAQGSSMAGRSIQQQYDIYYAQCMAAHGNQVPGAGPPPMAGPPPGSPPPAGAYVPPPPPYR
jgi:outer membrane lipoprotein SlyB